MAHAQKPDFVFRRNGRVHLNRQGRQFSRLLAAEVCASAVVMLDTPCSEVVWRVLATHSIRQFPLHFPLPCVTVCHQVSTGVYVDSKAPQEVGRDTEHAPPFSYTCKIAFAVQMHKITEKLRTAEKSWAVASAGAQSLSGYDLWGSWSTFLRHKYLPSINEISGVPKNFVRWGFNKFSSGQRERGSGGGSPLVRGSGGSCNLVQEISFHIVKFS